MTRPELRVYLAEWFCGCGSPEDAAGALLKLLRIHPLWDHQAELDEMLPDIGVRMLILYRLDRDELTEHGGTVEGAWLTPKGEAIRDALAREEADEFEALFEMHCVHGYDVTDDEHDCTAAD